jgi:hypothetical protein
MDDTFAELECEGEADYSAKHVRIACDSPDPAIEAIAIVNDYYVRGGFFGDTEGKWVNVSGEIDDHDALATLSPQKLLRLLQRSSSETERIGEEEIRGEATVGYRLTVDCEAAILECEGTAPVEVWIGDDGIVRRIVLDDDMGDVTFEFFDFGAAVNIVAPPADEVIEEDLVAGGTSSVGGGASGGIEVTCAEGDATPISQRRAISALRRHGIGMTDAEVCIIDNADPAAAALPDEGLITCGVDATPRAGAPTTVTRGSGELVDATFELHNLKCSIETGTSGRVSKIARLEQAFADLERSVPP